MRKLFHVVLVIGLLIASVGQTQADGQPAWTEEVTFLLSEVESARWDVQNPAEHIVPIARHFTGVTFSWADLSSAEFNQVMAHMPGFIKKARNTLRLSGSPEQVKIAVDQMLSLGECMITMANNFRNCEDAKTIGYLLGFIGRIGTEFAAAGRGHALMAAGLDIINDCNKQTKTTKAPVQAVTASDIDFRKFDAIFTPAAVASEASRGSTPDYLSDSSASSDQAPERVNVRFNPADQLKKKSEPTRGTHQTFNPAEQYLRKDPRHNQQFNPFKGADFNPEDYQ